MNVKWYFFGLRAHLNITTILQAAAKYGGKGGKAKACRRRSCWQTSRPCNKNSQYKQCQIKSSTLKCSLQSCEYNWKEKWLKWFVEKSVALVNISTNYGFKSVQDFLLKKQQEVDHTQALDNNHKKTSHRGNNNGIANKNVVCKEQTTLQTRKRQLSVVREEPTTPRSTKRQPRKPARLSYWAWLSQLNQHQLPQLNQNCVILEWIKLTVK